MGLRRPVCLVLLVIVMLAGTHGGFPRHADGVLATSPSTYLYDVRDYGAVGDGNALDTKAIQAAIDACASAGGGTVTIGQGTFLSRTLILKSDVTLHLEAGGVLLGSTEVAQYAKRALIYSEDAENIAITGRGVIDHQCHQFGRDAYEAIRRNRPQIIHFQRCRNVQVRDVTLKDSLTWVQIYSQCDGVVIDGITVDSRMNRDIEKPRFVDSFWHGRNQDGLTIEDSRNVRIANCHIFAGDDALVFKSEIDRGICKNIVVTNCVISSNASAIKFGTRSLGGFEDVTITNCAIYDTRITAIALESVDGGTFERVIVSNIVMDNIKGTALFIRLGNRRNKNPPTGSLRDVIVSNIQGTRIGGYDPSLTLPPDYDASFFESGKWDLLMAQCNVGCSITGLPGFPVKNVVIENVRLRCSGGGTREHAFRPIAEMPRNYPVGYMFETLPAYGFFVRHAENITFNNIDLDFEHDDERPAFVFEDVKHLDLFGIDAESNPQSHASLWLKQVTGALIHGCHLRYPATTFVRLDGAATADIKLTANHLSHVDQIFVQGKDVREGAVRVVE